MRRLWRKGRSARLGRKGDSMDSNHEKFRKWLEIARRTRPNSPFLKMDRSDDKYLEEQVRSGVGGYWIYIGIEEAKDCQLSDKPNVWFRVKDDGGLVIGLAFNSNASVELAENILKGYSAEVKKKLFDHMKSDTGWNSVLSIRKKYHTFADRPDYEDREVVPIDQLETEKIGEIFTKAKDIIKEYRERTKLPESDPGYLSQGGGVSLDLLYKELPANEDDFAKAFAFVQDALEICLEIKTPAQHKREMNKKYYVWECKSKQIKHLFDPKKMSVPVCDKCGEDCRKVGITKERWIEKFGYPPEESDEVISS